MRGGRLRGLGLVGSLERAGEAGEAGGELRGSWEGVGRELVKCQGNIKLDLD